MPAPNTSVRPQAILTFDVEEFDLPTECGRPIPFAQQITISEVGLLRVLEVLDRHSVRATFFTTAVFAQARPDLIRAMARRHEIASHSFRHGEVEPGDAARSKLALEAITHTPVLGYRKPRMGPVDYRELAQAGFLYDSSLHPTYLPGRYNHWRAPRRPHTRDGVLVIPASVTPICRVPLFWLAFRHFPRWWYRRCVARTLRADGAVNHYFHPWEFADIAPLGLPTLPSRGSGPRLVDKLDQYLSWLAPRADCVRFDEFARLLAAAPQG